MLYKPQVPKQQGDGAATALTKHKSVPLLQSALPAPATTQSVEDLLHDRQLSISKRTLEMQKAALPMDIEAMDKKYKKLAYNVRAKTPTPNQ